MVGIDMHLEYEKDDVSVKIHGLGSVVAVNIITHSTHGNLSLYFRDVKQIETLIRDIQLALFPIKEGKNNDR